MNTIYAPFTADQVARLIEWQSGTMWQVDIHGIERPMATHPFTCKGENPNECPNHGILIPGPEGLRCPCGISIQNWCHDFMVVQYEPSELAKLFKRVLLLAEEKQYPNYKELIDFDGFTYWQIDGMEYVNVVCSVLSKWLREVYNILVWIEPSGRPEGNQLFISYIERISENDRIRSVKLLPEHKSSYEYVWLAAIEQALKILPSAASQSDLLG